MNGTIMLWLNHNLSGCPDAQTNQYKVPCPDGHPNSQVHQTIFHHQDGHPNSAKPWFQRFYWDIRCPDGKNTHKRAYYSYSVRMLGCPNGLGITV